jgi:DNA-binding HxlR family transcriptional regulator
VSGAWVPRILGNVQRTAHPTNPPQVEYAVTPRGRAFEPVFRAMDERRAIKTLLRP